MLVVVDLVLAIALHARHPSSAQLDHGRARHVDRSVGRAAALERCQPLAFTHEPARRALALAPHGPVTLARSCHASNVARLDPRTRRDV